MITLNKIFTFWTGFINLRESNCSIFWSFQSKLLWSNTVTVDFIVLLPANKAAGR